MNKYTKRVLSFSLCICMTFIALNCTNWIKSEAASTSSLQNDIAKLQKESAALEKEISRLRGEKQSQSVVLSAVQKKIANIQAQVMRCNSEINSINAKIDANKKEINNKNKKIDESKEAFKKRIRAIYMSNTGSNIQVLLGADSFSEYLQLSQLTSSVSARDKKMIEDMVADIKELESKNEENKKLLESQVAVRETIVKAQKELEKEENAAQSIYDSIAAEEKQNVDANKAVEATIREKQNYLNSLLYGGANSNFQNSKVGFVWPVPSCRNITSYYGPRWGTIHKGIDISGGSIFGKPIVAITDGTVYQTYNSCPHKDRGSRCRCGSGWGNHVAIDHGIVQVNGVGQHIKAMYAHMNTIAVSNGQHVKQGQVIGYVGTTGDSTGYHLHFGIMRNNDGYVNPLNYY
ncbi:MAG: peptidoglycan DD-metalloendopeptidase family protein [Clostridia bacterium]|nr:peptidoglycan DD-metalloendopeptidase family protein [Clostridia bacterium]